MSAGLSPPAFENLTEIQLRAVNWRGSPLLVLAGPGSGKTQVLTCRIADLLGSSRGKNFRVLALTFTNKAADEMRDRVAGLVPGLEDRATIGTFHGFCASVLRQHGVHLGISPDFAIYSSDDDRQAVLEDGLRHAHSGGGDLTPQDVKYLGLIDRLKSQLIAPKEAEAALAHLEDRDRAAAAYRAYEDELRRINGLDFNSLVLEGYRLLSSFPAVAAFYRRTYPHLLIDEFQDTNAAQYRLVRTLAGEKPQSIFAVADDDQIIYEWNGANYKQIQSFLADFAADLIQLPTNYRCPAAIVDAANRLVVYNVKRSGAKEPLIAGKTDARYPPAQQLQLRAFPTDDAEALGIAEEIAEKESSTRGQIAVLARTRSLLDRVNRALHDLGVSSVIAQRRDEFLTAEFRWLVASLRQFGRPMDRRNLAVLVEAFNRLSEGSVSVDQVTTDAEATGRSYLATWLEAAGGQSLSPAQSRLLSAYAGATDGHSKISDAVHAILAEFTSAASIPTPGSDLAEDLAAWRELTRDIAAHIGKHAPLDQFLQQLQLRSKEPSPRPDTVTLMTIHGAKGREFDFVYVIGLAEDILPSFQSRKRGSGSPEMEEERRNCFVAITRTKECLVLSYAEKYRGWPKAPSRFLVEMGLVGQEGEVLAT